MNTYNGEHDTVVASTLTNSVTFSRLKNNITTYRYLIIFVDGFYSTNNVGSSNSNYNYLIRIFNDNNNKNNVTDGNSLWDKGNGSGNFDFTSSNIASISGKTVTLNSGYYFNYLLSGSVKRTVVGIMLCNQQLKILTWLVRIFFFFALNLELFIQRLVNNLLNLTKQEIIQQIGNSEYTTQQTTTRTNTCTFSNLTKNLSNYNYFLAYMDNKPGDSLDIMPGVFECYLYFCAGNIRSGTISGAFYTVDNGHNYTYLTTELPHNIFQFLKQNNKFTYGLYNITRQ